LNIDCVRGIDDVRLNHQVFIDEVSWISIIGVNAANFCGRQIDLIDLLRFKERPDGGLVDKVQLGAGASNDLSCPFVSSLRTSAEPTIPRWPAT
jgi:hypothetical protein